MIIGKLTEIADGTARAFSLDERREIFVVRDGDQIFAYLNSCPHTGAPLNWQPDQFLTVDKQWIQCANHDARFRIKDGFCVAGPCSGQALQSIAITVASDGAIIVPE